MKSNQLRTSSARSTRTTSLMQTFAALGAGASVLVGASHGLRAQETFDGSQVAPEVYEWYPYEPATVAVNDTLELFGDVDDFGGGVYTCTWQSDREMLDIQTFEPTGADWINFKSRLTYSPSRNDAGTRTITLTVEDPQGHTDTQTYTVEVALPGHLKNARSTPLH